MRLQLDSALSGTGVNGAGEAAASSAVRTGSGRAATNSSIGDSIQISGPSSALSRLSADRAIRLQHLTAMVQGGSYQVSGAQVSRALVEHAISGAD